MGFRFTSVAHSRRHRANRRVFSASCALRFRRKDKKEPTRKSKKRRLVTINYSLLYVKCLKKHHAHLLRLAYCLTAVYFSSVAQSVCRNTMRTVPAQ